MGLCDTSLLFPCLVTATIMGFPSPLLQWLWNSLLPCYLSFTTCNQCYMPSLQCLFSFQSKLMFVLVSDPSLSWCFYYILMLIACFRLSCHIALPLVSSSQNSSFRMTLLFWRVEGLNIWHHAGAWCWCALRSCVGVWGHQFCLYQGLCRWSFLISSTAAWRPYWSAMQSPMHLNTWSNQIS